MVPEQENNIFGFFSLLGSSFIFPRVQLRSYFCPYLGIKLVSKIPSFVPRKRVLIYMLRGRVLLTIYIKISMLQYPISMSKTAIYITKLQYLLTYI